jgi:hypothetical protein
MRHLICVDNRVPEISPVIAPRLSLLLIAALAGCLVLQPWRVHAQWWSLAPADFEACADVAEKAPTKEEKKASLTRCNAKFAGRRKPGGGYTYYDFMQDRSFDIAGPNPTPAEQKYIDEQYTVFLDRERHNTIVQELAAKQQQQERQQQQREQLQQAAFKSEAEKVPLPLVAPNKQAAAAAEQKARAKARACAAKQTFSCEWPRLSEGINNLKKALFGVSPSKTPAKRG